MPFGEAPRSSVVRHRLDYTTSEAGNPFVPGYYASPSTAFYDGLFWVFATAVVSSNGSAHLDAFSSPDLINWTKHSDVLTLSDASWARHTLHSPSSTVFKGKYYLYVSTQMSRSSSDDPDRKNDVAVGVFVSDRPQGPYMDAKGEPLIFEDSSDDEPLYLDIVFDAKTAKTYVYYANCSQVWVAKLNSNMISIERSSCNRGLRDITPLNYGVGARVSSRKGIYYLMWRATADPHIMYATANNPLGPFQPQDTMMKGDGAVAADISVPSLINVPDTDIWYAVYPRRPLREQDTSCRVLAYDRLYFDADDSIRPLMMLVKDNFADDRMLGWTTYGGEWSVREGRLFTDDLGSGMAVLDVDFADFTLDATIASTKGNGHPGLLFRVTELSSETRKYKGYKAALSPAGTITLGKADLGVFTDLKQARMDMGGISEHHVRVRANGAQLQIFVDDMETPKVEYEDSSFTHGTVGVRVYNSAAKFGSISVAHLHAGKEVFDDASPHIDDDDDDSVASSYDSLSKPEVGQYVLQTPTSRKQDLKGAKFPFSFLCCNRR